VNIKHVAGTGKTVKSFLNMRYALSLYADEYTKCIRSISMSLVLHTYTYKSNGFLLLSRVIYYLYHMPKAKTSMKHPNYINVSISVTE